MSINSKLLNPKFLFERRNRLFHYFIRALYITKRNLLIKLSYQNLNDRQLCVFRNQHIGHRCFIIGNGPSLRIADLQRLHYLKEITFGFNKIFLAFPDTDFRPTYLMVDDQIVARNIKDEIEALEPFIIKIFPYDYKPLLKNVFNAYFYYWQMRWELGSSFLFSPDPFHIGSGGMVTYTALQFAVYFGCNPIYLIGCDFSFDLPDTRDKSDNKILISQGEKNHFHPDYRKPGEQWTIPRMDDQLRAFESALEYAKQNGINIFNATRGGKLEVFERKNLDEVLHHP